MSVLLACALLAAACARPTVHRAVSMDSVSPSMAFQPGDCLVLAGEWGYVDGAVVRPALDEQGNSHYDWKDGRFETHTLIGHTCHGMWCQKENDQDVKFTIEFSPDFSEGERRGGTVASKPTMHPRKRAERFISARRPLL